MICKIYDPKTNRPTFSPTPRNEWVPLYPVYKSSQKYKDSLTWHYLFECRHCGTEIIHPLGSGVPKICECLKKRHSKTAEKFDKSRSAPINIKCTNCGGWYWTTKQKKGNTTRHYCSEECKKEYAVKCRPTAEWLALSNKVRDSRLKTLPKPGIYDSPYRASVIDNVLGV